VDPSWSEQEASSAHRCISTKATSHDYNTAEFAAEPRLGRYGEEEIRGFVAKLKSTMLHVDAAGTDGEEEANNSDDHADETDSDYASNTGTDDSGDDGGGDDDDDDDDGGGDYYDDIKQVEVDNDVATSSGTHDQRVATRSSIA